MGEREGGDRYREKGGGRKGEKKEREGEKGGVEMLRERTVKEGGRE